MSLRGGAEPRPKRLRWHVYADELPTPPATSDSASTTAVDELRAQLMSQIEANRLLDRRAAGSAGSRRHRGR